MSAGSQLVVEHFNRMVEPDGGLIELVSIHGSTLHVRYRPGQNPECASCVLDPNDLRDLMQEALQLQDPVITKVTVEVVRGR